MMQRLDPSALQYITPLPPLQTGIAGYSSDLLQAVDGVWSLRIVPEPGSRPDSWWTLSMSRSPFRTAPAIVHVGNSGYHPIATSYPRRTEVAPILVLHDAVLHHGRLAVLARRRGGRSYIELMASLYGDTGRAAARAISRGIAAPDVEAFPLIEDLVALSRVTLVHSEYARQLVLDRVPAATVVHVPMGIPLPQLVPQDEARSMLSLPPSAFIVGSVTHVNPNKRLDVVLRAIRRARERIPDIVLVVAGSVSPAVDLRQLAQSYGVAENVRLLGYVSDAEARLVARASDVCVNLRYPSAGETSASLLRLLGAGRPVIVTDDRSTSEYPRSVVLPVPVDAFEDEMVAELLVLLASDDGLRGEVGCAARTYIEQEHSMQAMVDGYRDAVRLAYRIALPPIGHQLIHESLEFASPSEPRGPGPVAYTSLDARLGDVLVRGGVASHDGTMRRVARTVIRLRLDELPRDGKGSGDV